jgi:hypothetical protein
LVVGHWPDEFSSDDPSRDEWERRPDNRRDEAEYRFALAYLASYATWVADGSNVNDRVLDYRQWWDYPGEGDSRSARLRPQAWGVWRAERVVAKGSRMQRRRAWQSQQAEKRAATAKAAAERISGTPLNPAERVVLDEFVDAANT